MRRRGETAGSRVNSLRRRCEKKNRRSLCLSALTGAFKGSFIMEVNTGSRRRGISSDATMFCDTVTMDAFIASGFKGYFLILGPIEFLNAALTNNFLFGRIHSP